MGLKPGKLPAPLIRFTVCLRNILLMWGGGGAGPLRRRTGRCARAVRKGGCFPPPVAAGPKALNCAPPMPLSVGHARVCRGVWCAGVLPGSTPE